MSWRNTVLAALTGILAVTLSGCGQGDDAPAPAPSEMDATGLSGAIVSLNNRGVGEMGYFDYGAARETFAEVVTQAPDWLEGRVNLAIATLNRQEPGDEERALALVSAVLAEDPGHLRAHFVSGILRFNQGAIEEARGHFETVHRADPGDAYAAYYFGQCELQLGRAEAARKAFAHAVARDPYLRSAWYAAFQAEQRLGQREAARELLAAYQRLERNPRSRLAEIKYTRMGPRAEALAVRSPVQGSEPAPHRGTRGSETWRLLEAGNVRPLAGSPLVDDRWQWLAIPGDAGLVILDPSGASVPLPFAGDRLVTAIAWGDIDNDGLTDVYLGRDGPDQLWRQVPDPGGWVDVSADWGLALDGTTDDVLILDADHDGDLDAFVVRAGAANELLNNNGDGTFRTLAADRGLEGDGSGGRVSAADLDGDRDLDLVVATPAGKVTVFLNDRLWDYRAIDGPGSLDGPAVVTADLEADGAPELCGISAGNIRCWTRVGETWIEERTWPADQDIEALALSDTDGDGRWEFLTAGGGRTGIVDGDDGPTITALEGTLLGVWQRDPARGPELIVQESDGTLHRHFATGEFTGLSFSGREDAGESMRSNASGLGTRYVLRNGSSWTVGWLLATDSGPGAGLQPTLIGQPARPAEYVEIDWSDGVFQTELGLEPGRLHRITETQRQLASCPVLFAWDGTRHRFLSDVLGVGGIGFAVGPGNYAQPRPWEAFRIDADSLAPLDGAFELRLTEPMEETAYVDGATLVAIDRPGDFHLVLDERMATDGSEPSGEPVFHDAIVAPRSAIDAEGRSVLEELRTRDDRAAPPGPRDPRFLGLLASEQVLTLEFDTALDALASPVLLLDGWVEYGYSQTSFAAWQAGRTYEPPSLEARDADGTWHLVAPSFGYPAGMPREAAFRLPALPPGARALRVRTNQEIYFDRLVVIEPRTVPEAREHRLPLAEARLERIGFPRRTDGPQRRPDYDYELRDPFWDTRYQRGFYTRTGEVTPLLIDTDNGLAIVGPGDALVLRFEADLPTLPEGWRRDFVVRFDGWAKDMDLYTRTGETVGPLPARPVAVDRAEALHARFNTRFQAGR